MNIRTSTLSIITLFTCMVTLSALGSGNYKTALFLVAVLAVLGITLAYRAVKLILVILGIGAVAKMISGK